MSPSIYPSIRGSGSQNKRPPFDRSSNSFFFWVGYFDKIWTYIIYLSIYLSIYIYIYIYPYLEPPGMQNHRSKLNSMFFFAFPLKNVRSLKKRSLLVASYLARVSGIVNPWALLLAAVATPTRLQPANQKNPLQAIGSLACRPVCTTPLCVVRT